MDIIAALICGVAIGMITGCLLMRVFLTPKYAGILRLYDSGPDEGIQLYLQLDESPENLIDCEYVNFKVKVVNI